MQYLFSGCLLFNRLYTGGSLSDPEQSRHSKSEQQLRSSLQKQGALFVDQTYHFMGCKPLVLPFLTRCSHTNPQKSKVHSWSPQSRSRTTTTWISASKTTGKLRYPSRRSRHCCQRSRPANDEAKTRVTPDPTQRETLQTCRHGPPSNLRAPNDIRARPSPSPSPREMTGQM